MIESAQFKALAGAFPSGVTVVTARDPEGGAVGATVSAFMAVSLDPPMIAISLARGGRTHATLSKVDEFVVNILRDDQEQTARAWAEYKDERFLAMCDLGECGPCGSPMICDALANIVCRIIERYRVGDHTIVVGLVIGGRVREGRPLIHCRGQFRT